MRAVAENFRTSKMSFAAAAHFCITIRPIDRKEFLAAGQYYIPETNSRTYCCRLFQKPNSLFIEQQLSLNCRFKVHANIFVWFVGHIFAHVGYWIGPDHFSRWRMGFERMTIRRRLQ